MKSQPVWLTVFPSTIVILIFQVFIFLFFVHPNHQSFSFSFILLKPSDVKITSFVNLNPQTLPFIAEHLALINFAFGGDDYSLSVSFPINNGANVYFPLIEGHFGSPKLLAISKLSQVEREWSIPNKIF
jgi:hypothetical protein